HASVASPLAITVSGRTGVARVHSSAGSHQCCYGRAVTCRGLSATRRATRCQSRVEWFRLRRAVGILELLGRGQMALHGADHGKPEDFRDAGAWLSRVPGVCARMLHDVRVRPGRRDQDRSVAQVPTELSDRIRVRLKSDATTDPSGLSPNRSSKLMQMSSPAPLEREIKLRFESPEAARAAVVAAGAGPLRPRRLQSDVLFDTEQRMLSARGEVLRV